MATRYSRRKNEGGRQSLAWAVGSAGIERKETSTRANHAARDKQEILNNEQYVCLLKNEESARHDEGAEAGGGAAF